MGKLISMLLALLCLGGCTGGTLSQHPQTQSQGERTLKITVGDYTFLADLEDSSSADAFAALLEKGPVTISMADYGGFEQVGALGTTLPRNDRKITTQPGDVILYGGNQITIYYAPNTWSFTRLAKIRNPEGLEAKLGEGTVTVPFSLS